MIAEYRRELFPAVFSALTPKHASLSQSVVQCSAPHPAHSAAALLVWMPHHVCMWEEVTLLHTFSQDVGSCALRLSRPLAACHSGPQCPYLEKGDTEI